MARDENKRPADWSSTKPRSGRASRRSRFDEEPQPRQLQAPAPLPASTSTAPAIAGAPSTPVQAFTTSTSPLPSAFSASAAVLPVPPTSISDPQDMDVCASPDEATNNTKAPAQPKDGKDERANSGASSWPDSLSELARKREEDAQLLAKRANEFKAKAEARLSSLVQSDPQCIADLGCFQQATTERRTLALPLETDSERHQARGVYGDLERIQSLLKRTPVHGPTVAHRIKMDVSWWALEYKEPRPAGLDQLMSSLKALAGRLEGQDSAPSGAATAGPAEDQARLYLESLGATLAEAGDELKCAEEGHKTLDSGHSRILTDLAETKKRLAKYESLVEIAKRSEAKLTSQEKYFALYLEISDEALGVQRSCVEQLKKRLDETRAKVEQARQRREDLEPEVPADVSVILSYSTEGLN